jgi:hypothetical protein
MRIALALIVVVVLWFLTATPAHMNRRTGKISVGRSCPVCDSLKTGKGWKFRIG